MDNTNMNTNASGGMGWTGFWQKKKALKIIGLVIIVMILLGVFCGDRRDGWKGNNDVISTITVSGKGEVVVAPDIATVSFGVTAESKDVAKAQTDSNTKMNNIIEALKSKGVEAKDIKTTNYNIYPRYDYVQSATYPNYGGKQVLVAYVVSQNVEVKIRKISTAGDILSTVGGLGVTDVSGLTFSVDKVDEVKDQARGLAIDDAKAQAKVLAKGLGVRLVRITNFSESGNMPIYYGLEKSMAVGMGGSDAVPAPQLQAGENKITSNVSITYEIR